MDIDFKPRIRTNVVYRDEGSSITIHFYTFYKDIIFKHTSTIQSGGVSSQSSQSQLINNIPHTQAIIKMIQLEQNMTQDFPGFELLEDRKYTLGTNKDLALWKTGKTFHYTKDEQYPEVKKEFLSKTASDTSKRPIPLKKAQFKSKPNK